VTITDGTVTSSANETVTVAQATPTVVATMPAERTHTNPFSPRPRSRRGQPECCGQQPGNRQPDVHLLRGHRHGGHELGGTAPTAAGTYTVVASFAGAPITSRPAAARDLHHWQGDADRGGYRCRWSVQWQSVFGHGHSCRRGQPECCGRRPGNRQPDVHLYVGTGTGGMNLGGAAPSAVSTYTVVASFAGSADYLPASSSPVTFTINNVQPQAACGIPPLRPAWRQ